MKQEELIKIKESLEELIADPEIDFGPSYELTKVRQKESLRLIRKAIAENKTNRELSYELLGVIVDVEEGAGFDDVCLNTIKRVHTTLSGN